MLKIGNMDTNLYTFCENPEETIYHLVWECPKVHHLLVEFVRVCHFYGTTIKIDHKTFIFGDLDGVKSKCSILYCCHLLVLTTLCVKVDGWQTAFF